MAIPIRFFTAVLKKTAIEAGYPGGLVRFLQDRPGVSQDRHLVGVPFMSGYGLQCFIDLLRATSFDISGGLAVGEMVHGEWEPCDGIEFRTVGSADSFPEWEAVVPRKEIDLRANNARGIMTESLLAPGTICTTVGANDKEAGQLVVVLQFVGAFPHAGVVEGYWVGTLNRLPFASIDVYRAADGTFNTAPNKSNAAIMDRRFLRPLVVVNGKVIDPSHR